jgi:hypothetical protein
MDTTSIQNTSNNPSGNQGLFNLESTDVTVLDYYGNIDSTQTRSSVKTGF